MKFLKLRIKFSAEDPEDREKMENLGLPHEPKFEDGFIFINPAQIVSFNEATSHGLILSMTDRDLKVELSLEEFIEKLKELN